MYIKFITRKYSALQELIISNYFELLQSNIIGLEDIPKKVLDTSYWKSLLDSVEILPNLPQCDYSFVRSYGQGKINFKPVISEEDITKIAKIFIQNYFDNVDSVNNEYRMEFVSLFLLLYPDAKIDHSKYKHFDAAKLWAQIKLKEITQIGVDDGLLSLGCILVEKGFRLNLEENNFAFAYPRSNLFELRNMIIHDLIHDLFPELYTLCQYRQINGVNCTNNQERLGMLFDIRDSSYPFGFNDSSTLATLGAYHYYTNFAMIPILCGSASLFFLSRSIKDHAIDLSCEMAPIVATKFAEYFLEIKKPLINLYNFAFTTDNTPYRIQPKLEIEPVIKRAQVADRFRSSHRFLPMSLNISRSILL